MSEERSNTIRPSVLLDIAKDYVTQVIQDITTGDVRLHQPHSSNHQSWYVEVDIKDGKLQDQEDQEEATILCKVWMNKGEFWIAFA